MGISAPNYQSNREATSDESATNGHLVCDARQCLLREIFRNASHLKQHGAWLDACCPVINIGFTLTHAGFEWLLRNWLVWEDANVNLALTTEEVLCRNTTSFDLPRREPMWLKRLQTLHSP